jgi:aspartyl-tRNA(Asn)/glutamyl-tRNA(Gln) amidotransferase subunit C
MKIGRDDVLKIAQLAELAVDEADLPKLVEQLDSIVGYVAQLDAVPAEADIAPFVPGPESVAWRADEVRPQPLALPPGALAPAFRNGFFVVPRLTGMDEA